MPNTFGRPYTEGISGAQAYKLVDPRESRNSRKRFLRDEIPELALANSFRVPSGREPARGWILLVRSDYNSLRTQGGLFATNYELEFDQFDADAPKIKFKNLAIVQARCVTAGQASETNSVYLVELTDARGVLASRWFRKPTASYYNVRAPAYPGEYYDGSLNVFNPWTWSDMVGDLWSQMGTLLGTYGGLPSTPAGLPEDWIFPGVSAWDALCDVLEHLGMTVAVDLTATQPYTVVDKGIADTVYDTLEARFAKRIEDDFEWIDVGSGRVPGRVVVHFLRRNEIYGTEETVRKDSFQWEMRPLYTVDLNAPAPFSGFSGAQGTHHIWDDFQVRYDVDGNPLAADTATAATIAAERVLQYFQEIYSGTLGSLRRVYTGLIPFSPGTSLDEVCWRQDFRNRQGFVTEVRRG